MGRAARLSLAALAAGLALAVWALAPSGSDQQPAPFRMALLGVPNGEFCMGADEPPEPLLEVFPTSLYGREAADFSDEPPRHLVRISRPFRMGCYEVTVGQFRRFVRETG